MDAGPSVATGVLALSIVLSANALASEFWPRFRGPNGSGVSESGRLPTEFGLKTNLAWKTAVPTGSSSPIVAATRVFLTGYEGDRLLVRCLDLNKSLRRPEGIGDFLHKVNEVQGLRIDRKNALVETRYIQQVRDQAIETR